MYSEVLDDLRKEIRNCFVDLSHKEVFDLLYKEAWHPEEASDGKLNVRIHTTGRPS